MAQSSTGLSFYMTEKVSVRRWEQYIDRFLLMFFALVAAQAIFEVPARVYVISLVASLVCGASFYWQERYEDNFLKRHEWAGVIFWTVILVILLAIIWHHEAHRPDGNRLLKPFINQTR